MKTEGLILLGIAAFFFAITGIYWFTSYEETGTVLLLFTTGLGLIPGVWLVVRSRHRPPRLEDQDDAAMAEGAGSIGSFPESSVWPLVFALGLALSGVGFVYGAWFALIGAPLAFAALVGSIMEGRRGAEPEEGVEEGFESH